MQGCDCCLSSTPSVSTCFLETRECGPGFCNCDAQNASCVVAQAPLEAILAEWGADPSCQACSAAYLPRVEGSEEVKASSELQAACDGTVGLTHGKVRRSRGWRGQGPLHECAQMLWFVAVHGSVLPTCRGGAGGCGRARPQPSW